MTIQRIFAVLILLVVVASPVRAESTLHIGFGSGTACATGCGGDPNLSPGPSSIFNIFQNSGGASTIDSVLLILGVPNATDPNLFSDGSITGLTSINPYPGGTVDSSNTWTFGTDDFGLDDGSSGVGDGYQGEFTSSTGGDVYGFLGIGDAVNNSNNWTNWHGAVQTYTGLEATGFGIYVFGLNGLLGPKGLLDIEFADSGTVPLGSILIAYGEGSHYATPFTESGFQTPEPTSLLLMGTGLLGIGRLYRKKQKKA